MHIGGIRTRCGPPPLSRRPSALHCPTRPTECGDEAALCSPSTDRGKGCAIGFVRSYCRFCGPLSSNIATQDSYDLQ